jgi:hypothetical protein
MIVRDDPNFIRTFPAFTVKSGDAVPVRLAIALKRPRVVIGLGDNGDSAYIAGFVDVPGGKEEAVYAFLTEEDDRRLLQGGARLLKAAAIEGRWSDYVLGIGFSLRDCLVDEEEA